LGDGVCLRRILMRYFSALLFPRNAFNIYSEDDDDDDYERDDDEDDEDNDDDDNSDEGDGYSE
jgi:hypothetical protein